MSKMLNGFSDEDLETVRNLRNNSLHPPDVEPGMEEDDDTDKGWGNIKGLGDDGDDDGWGVPSENDDSDEAAFGSLKPKQGWGDNNSQPSTQKTQEDKIWDVVAAGGQKSFNFIKAVVKSFKTFDTPKRMEMGRNLIVSSGVVVVGSIVCMFLSVPSAFSYLIAGILGMGVGVPVFMIAMDNLQHYTPSDTNNEGNEDVLSGERSDIPMEDINEEASSSSEAINTWMIQDEEEQDDAPKETGFKSAFEESNPFESKEVEHIDAQTVLNNLNNNNGMMTRQYLYETITSVLESKNKNYNRVIELDEDSKEFLSLCKIIQDVAESMCPTNAEQMPQLLRAKDRLFYLQLEIQKVKWLKNIDTFVDEVVKSYSVDSETGELDKKITGSGYSAGGTIYIKIMKGATTMVSVKDTYNEIKDKILDTHNYMPVVFGINADGTAVWRDLKSMNALLVSGMPDSGKSWCVKTLLAQMMFFLPPSELEFVFLDPKAATSDFYNIKVPHVKKFVSTDEGILQELRRIVKVEAERRRKIMKEAGDFIDFWDVKKKRPDIKLPLLYVVIDEVITLSDRMDKETKAEFQGLLSQLVSQMRNLGIRIIMIPHVVKDQVLKKTITDLIPCRISVRGNADHVQKTTGATPKEFPFVLANKGDMAVKLDNDIPVFVHGAVLSDTSDGITEIFEFLEKMWLKLEPSSKVENNAEVKNKPVFVSTPTKKASYQLKKEEVDELLSELNDDKGSDIKDSVNSEDTEDDEDGEEVIEDLWR